MVNDSLINFVELPAQALRESVNSIILSLPRVITALLILLLGWVIAKISEVIIFRLLVASGFDEWVARVKLKKSLFNISISRSGSLIVKYYIILVFLQEASSRAGLSFLANMFNSVLTAIPNITIGSIILVIALLFADFVRRNIKRNVIPFNEAIAEVIYGVIIFFAIVMALPKFGLTNTSLLEDSFKYIVLGISLGISLAIGIGFGWAIKEGPAKEFFKKRRR